MIWDLDINYKGKWIPTTQSLPNTFYFLEIDKILKLK